MNQPKKFADLLAGATQGPWKTESLGHQKHAINAKSWDELATVYGNLDDQELRREGEINVQFIARCNPAVMREVWEALEDAGPWLQELADEGDSAQWVLEKHAEIAAKIRRAIALLDGQEQPNRENGPDVGRAGNPQPKQD